MPNVNSSGKFGTSMDCSTLTEIRRKYRIYGHDPTRFNRDQVSSGRQEPASVYYAQRGLYPVYTRLMRFGIKSS
jgi:hypothetical protein